MSEHLLDAAGEISGIQVGSGYESVTIGITAALEAARALDAAGLLATPEHDAEVRADERAKVRGRDAALRAWTNAGPRPDVHHKAKDVVRKTMPVLARALDEGERGLT